MAYVAWPYLTTTFLPSDGKSVFDVTRFGARGDGTTDDRGAIQAAIDAANAAAFGGVVYFPPGTYRVNMSSGALIAKSNVTLRGAGRALSVVWKDDSTGDSHAMLHNVSTWPAFNTLTNFAMEGLGFKGRADVVKTASSGQLVMLSADDLRIDNCAFSYSRGMAVNVSRCRRAVITNCLVYRSIADGIAAWNCSDLIITKNEIIGANDDAISCHSDDSLPAPVRSGVLIADNQITESQGIAVLGLKSVVITGNILRRIMGTGMRLRAAGTDVQGQSPQFSARIENNVINDVFLRSEPSPRSASQFYILISGGVRRANGAAVPPGEIDPATGTAVSYYGTNGVGTLYANETGSGGAPAPAGYAIDIVNNTLMRTLPSVTSVDQWGYNSGGLWVGNNGDGSGFYNGAITEAALNTNGIEIDPALWDSRIAFNTIRTGGAYGIRFRATETVGNLDFCGLRIEGNKISHVSHTCIYGPATTTKQRVVVINNDFDGDPFHVHSNRKTGPRDGSWLVSGAPYGVYFQTTGGGVIEGNTFRNLCTMVEYGGVSATTLVRRNYAHCEPVAFGFSTSNKGIGVVLTTGIEGIAFYIQEDSNPTSATYGQTLSTPLNVASAMPATGLYVRGHFVYNQGPDAGEYLGWMRLTTGTGHVLNTDWKVVGAIV